MPSRASSESIGLIRNLSCWNADVVGNHRPEDECEDKRDQVYRLDSPYWIDGQHIPFDE